MTPQGTRFKGFKIREKRAIYHALDNWLSAHDDSDDLFVVAGRLQRDVAESLWPRKPKLEVKHG